jgi:hypothetical protein
MSELTDPFFLEGQEAYQNGCERSDCSYDDGTDGQAGWMRGWFKASFAATLKEHKGHWWSGWPGAYCMKCGAGHALEVALAEGWFDGDTWNTEEHRKIVELADGSCPADQCS